jgi:hypothetical protein
MTICEEVRDDPTQVVQIDDCRPTDDVVLPGTRYLLRAFAVLTALATHQLVVFGDRTERFWPWTIHSRASVGFLAAAYAAGFVLSVLALRERSWRRVRVAVATVTVFTLLTLVPTLLHAHRLHLTDPDPIARGAAWFWLAIYVIVPLAGLSVLGRQQEGVHRPAAVRRPLPHWLRTALAVQGSVLLVAGLALFVGGCATHHGMNIGEHYWPWTLAPLGAQAIGAWLIAFGVGAALVLREGDLERLRVPAIAYTAFGVFQAVALVLTRQHLDGPAAAAWLYGALLAAVVLTGGYGWWAIRRSTAPLPR